VQIATVVTVGDAFPVRSHDCAILVPSATCTVRVGYTAGDARRLPLSCGKLRVEGEGDRYLHSVPLQGRAHVAVTGLDMQSQTGDWVGAGSSWSFRSIDLTLDARVNGPVDPSRVELRVMPTSAAGWHLVFSSGGGTLDAGETYRVDPDTYPHGPEIDISGERRACDVTTGEFTAEQIEFDDDGALRAFAATFRQHCERATATLTGAVAWAADHMPTVPAPLPVPPVSELDASTDIYSTLLTWSNPMVDTWTDTVVRTRPGRIPPRADAPGTENGPWSTPGVELLCSYAARSRARITASPSSRAIRRAWQRSRAPSRSGGCRCPWSARGVDSPRGELPLDWAAGHPLRGTRRTQEDPDVRAARRAWSLADNQGCTHQRARKILAS
jgi:hypothetical protein